jgi:hypothetical protein
MGGAGEDTLMAQDGQRDALRGGTGNDEASVDAIDSRSGVETVG